MADTIRLRVVRALQHQGQPCAPGAVLSVGALDAHALLAGGRAVLCDSADLARIAAAVEAQNTRTMSRVSRDKPRP